MLKKLKSLLGLQVNTPSAVSTIQIMRGELPEWKYELRSLNQQETQWLGDRRLLGVSLVHKYHPTFDGLNSGLASALDAAFKVWLEDRNPDKAPAAHIVEGLGALYAELFIQLHGFQWVWVTSEYGADFAVHHVATQNFVFPMGVIQKRVDKGEWGFFENIFLVTQAEVLASAAARSTQASK
jgi:Domain of unknown function (DUF3806)